MGYDPFRLLSPCVGESPIVRTPFGMFVVPVAHDLIYLAAIKAARLRFGLFDEVAEKLWTWRKGHMVDIAIQRLVHSNHEPRHRTLLKWRIRANLTARRNSLEVRSTGCTLQLVYELI